MSFFDKLKQMLDLDLEDEEFEDFDAFDEWSVNNSTYKPKPLKLIDKFNKKTDKGISEELQEKLVMNEDLSIKECIELIEHATNKLNKSIGLNDKER